MKDIVKRPIPYRTLAGRGSLAALFLSLALPACQAQNLLKDAHILVSTNAGAAWAEEVAFAKEGRYPVQLRAEFVVNELPKAEVLSLRKPDLISEWKLNGRELIGPPKDMFYTLLEGIPVSGLKTGTNVLEAKCTVNVGLRDGKLSPTVAKYALDLQPGDISKFEIRTGPVLGAVGSDYFTVGCRTRMPAVVTLECDGRKWTSEPGVIHRLRANGLKAGKTYGYKLVAQLAGGSAKAESKTWNVRIPRQDGPVTFVAVGDARNNPKVWSRIAQEILKVQPDFVLHTGDIVGNGNDYEAWDREFGSAAPDLLASIPCFYTFGNHENNVAMLYKLFGFPQDERSSYTETIGPVQVFAMNRFENWGKGSPNLARMEKELAASKAPFVFAFTHPPSWSSGSHGNDRMGIDVHFPLFDRYEVTAEVAGHDHCYERSEPGGTTMLIAGGAGAPLYRQEKLAKNPHSKIYRSEYGFLVFKADNQSCTLKAYTYGGLKTPDAERKLQEVDTRTWTARNASQAAR